MSVFLIELGAEVKSKITGFAGMVTSRSEHLNGCNRYWIAPKCKKDGKLPDGSWIDEGEIIVLKSPVLKRQNADRGGFPSMIK
jgi:hypothetical protein